MTSLIKAFPASERIAMRVARMVFIKGTPKLFAPTSHENFVRFATLYPNLGRGFLNALYRLGPKVQKVIFPSELVNDQNHEIIIRFVKDHKFAKSLIKNNTLDLRSAGLKQKDSYRDLTLEFEDCQTIEKLKGFFLSDNLAIIKQDFEVKVLSLYHALWMVRILLYQAEEKRGAARREGDKVNLCESQATIQLVANYLEWMANNVPLERAISGKILSETPRLIRIYNTPAADAVLVSLTNRLESMALEIEKKRIRDEWRRQSRRRPPRSRIEETVVHLAERRYKISFAPDGLWTIPQGGFRSAGPALKRSIILHVVPSEKVLRREQHKIESITREIAINADFAHMLKGFVQILKRSKRIDYEQILSKLAEAYLAYEKGIVRPKFKTRLMIKLALELVKTARDCYDEKAKERLLSFAGSMCEAAARQLLILNENLGVQLRRIAAKLKIEEAIVAQTLAREANLRSFSESLLRSIVNRKIIDSPKLLSELRWLMVEVREGIQVDDQAEYGIKRAVERLKRMANLLAKTRRLVQEKFHFRKNIIDARRNYKVQAGALKAIGKTQEIPKLYDEAVGHLRSNLEKIQSHNEEIVQTLQEVVWEVINLKLDLVNKNLNYETVSTEDKKKIEEEREKMTVEHQKVFEELIKLNDASNYQAIFDARGNEIGRACRFDVWYLSLRTEPKRT